MHAHLCAISRIALIIIRVRQDPAKPWEQVAWKGSGKKC